MKVAIVHELLTMKGGAERVARVLAEMFPDAPVYTLLYNEKKMGDWFPKERVRTPQAWPFSWAHSHLSHLTTHIFNHHLYLPFFPRAAEAWDFSGYDLVISSSSAFVHGIITNGSPKHLCYVQSPARYLWDRTHDVQQRSGIARHYLSPLFHRLRIWDAEAAARPDMLLAASAEIQRRTQLYWNRQSAVLHPPIDDFWFEPASHPSGHTDPYFLIVSTLVPYKQIEIAIEACNEADIRLLVVGTGPDRARLEKIAGPTVQFLGYQPEEEVRSLYTYATATIFPGYEDFGLVPVESMACGTPVIAYRGGGALETIIEGETGAFFDEQTPTSLATILRNFDHNKYSEEKCRLRGQEFRKSEFEQQLRTRMEELVHPSA